MFVGFRAWLQRGWDAALQDMKADITGQKKTSRKRKPPAPVVRVAPLHQRFTGEERSSGWAYFYRATGEPSLGQKVIAPFGFDNEEQVFRIIGFGRDGYKGPLKSITRLPRR